MYISRARILFLVAKPLNQQPCSHKFTHSTIILSVRQPATSPYWLIQLSDSSYHWHIYDSVILRRITTLVNRHRFKINDLKNVLEAITCHSTNPILNIIYCIRRHTLRYLKFTSSFVEWSVKEKKIPLMKIFPRLTFLITRCEVSAIHYIKWKMFFINFLKTAASYTTKIKNKQQFSLYFIHRQTNRISLSQEP